MPDSRRAAAGGRLLANLANGTVSFGVGITMPSVEVVDAYGAASWDVFYANMHSSRIDWHDVFDMVRAAQAWDITSCVRIPMQPWVGGDNPGLSVDAHRAFSLGAPVVMASVRSAAEARSLVEITDWEQRRLGRELLTIVAVETKPAWDSLDEILSVDGLRVAFLGVSDLAETMGAADLEDRTLRELVTAFVERANRRGVRVAVNTGYVVRPEQAWATSLARVRWLREAGADIVFALPNESFLKSLVQSFIDEVREIDQGPAHPANAGAAVPPAE